VGGVEAAVVGHIAAQIGRHGVRHDQHRHPEFSTLGLRKERDGRQTRIALAAFNLRQMLRPNWQLRAHLGRQHLQRQTTLVALAAQEGGNQSNGMVAPSLNGIDVPKWRWNFDHLNERERPR
jgi:hypothetical protein